MSWDNLVKLAHLARFGNGQDWKKVAADDGEFPVYGSGGQFGWASEFLHDGEAILFGRKGTVDHPIYVDGKFWTVDTMYYAVPNTDRCRGKYLYYWATTIPFKTIATNTALPSVTSMDLSQLYVPLPPLETQQRIADYLDRETAEIDAAVADLDKYVELLEKRRAIVLTEMIYGGENRTKEQVGVWNYVCVNPHTPEFQELEPGEEITFFPLDAIWSRGQGDASRTIPWDKRNSSYTQFRRGDILVPKVTPTVFHGRSMIAESKTPVGLATSEVHVLRPNRNVDPNWLVYALISNHFLDRARGEVFGVGGLQRISANYLASFKVPLTSLAEQREIVAYLDAEISEIDALIADSTKLRDLLIKRRSVLITEVVTGRKQV